MTPGQVARKIKIHQWTPGIQLRWTSRKIQAALSEHARGNFAQSSKLVEAMWEDDELPTSQSSSINFIVGSDFILNPITKDKEPVPASQALVEQLSPYWDESYPASEMARLLSWFQMLGVAVGCLDWSLVDGKWSPKLRVLNPQFLWWDEFEKDPQTGLHGVFKYQSKDKEHIVTPGDGTWVLLSDGRESWMRASVRALAETWLVKHQTIRDLARYLERHGLPIVKAMVPSFADGPDKSNFFADVRNLGSDTTVLLPSHMNTEGAGYDLELLEATDGSWEAFIATLERCDRKFQVHFMGTNTNELIDGAGSRATSESGRSISMQKAQELINRVKSDIRSQLVRPFFEVNGIIFLDRDLPEPTWLVEGDEDMGKRAQTLEYFGKALTAIGAGYEITNIDDIAAEYGLTLKKKESEDQPGQTGPQNRGGDGKENNAKPKNGGENLDNLHDCGLSSPEVPVETVGKRSGFESGQDYLDRLNSRLTYEADILEEVDAETLSDLVVNTESPEQLLKMLSFYVSDGDSEALGHLYEKAMLLAQLAGRFAVQEDL